MYTAVREQLVQELSGIQAQGLWKAETIITSPQGAEIQVGGRMLLNFCANNYLGLSAHPEVLAAAHHALDTHGFGLSSVRFICGTQSQHRALERELAAFLGTDDAILYSSCFDANGGVFETLFGADDAIISDELNHTSIIDGPHSTLALGTDRVALHFHSVIVVGCAASKLPDYIDEAGPDALPKRAHPNRGCRSWGLKPPVSSRLRAM